MSVTSYWRGSLSTPPPFKSQKKVRGHWLACLKKPCFQTFRKEMGEGRSLAKKKIYKKIQQSIRKICTFRTIKLLYNKPQHSLIGQKHPSATRESTLDPIWHLQHIFSLEYLDSLKKGFFFQDWPQQTHTTVTSDLSIQTHLQPCACSECARV